MIPRGVWLATWATLAAASVACAQGVPPAAATRTGTLGRTPVTESSGVAVSRRHAGLLWTHNDSDHDPNLYAISLQGELLATISVSGASVEDWEDLSLGRCPARWPDRPCLYIADTGDNDERRPHAALYVLPEPEMLTPSAEIRPSQPAQALRVHFTDGARDIEALAVDSLGVAHLITKGRSGHIVRYAVPRDAWRGDSVVVAPADTLPIRPQALVGRWVTGAAISPSGRRAAVRTFTEVFFFAPATPRWAPVGPPCRIAGLEPQGEAVDFLDEERLVLTSEKGLAPEGVIHEIRCS
jgi:hypothetical protein